MTTASINWKISKPDMDLVNLIVKRAHSVPRGGAFPQDTTMDLIAAHLNGCPLDLPKLLAFDEFDFYHDIDGIAAHINRDTGALGGCFLPRCARKDGEA